MENQKLRVKKMGCWSAENATKAYLETIKMGKMAKEPDVAEFISALAGGNNVQLMVVACAATAGATTLGLVAAAHQTGGRVICIVRSLQELHLSRNALGHNTSHVEFVIGEAQTLILTHYREADLVIFDCSIEKHEEILRAVAAAGQRNSTIALGYNAFCKEDLWRWSGGDTQLLPIGGGLLLTKIGGKGKSSGHGKRSQWVVRVDKCTGEEHVFMVRCPHGRVAKA